MRYRQPVPVKTAIRVVGRIVRLRGRLGRAEGRILLPGGAVACEAQMILADIPTELLPETRFADLGWAVDP